MQSPKKNLAEKTGDTDEIMHLAVPRLRKIHTNGGATDMVPISSSPLYSKTPHSITLGAAIALCLASIFSPAPAHADDLASLQAQAASIQSQIEEAQAKLDDASRDYDDALACESTARKAAEKAEAGKKATEEELDRLHERMGDRSVLKYKQDPVSLIDAFLSADSIEEMECIVVMLDELDAYDAKLSTEQDRLREQLAEQEEIARTEEAEACKQKDEADAIKREAEEEMADLDALYDSISAEVEAIIRRQQMAAAYSSAGINGPVSASGTDWSGVSVPADANDIVARAYSALGSNYSWGGVGNGGYDCSGLVSYCVSGEHVRIGTASTFLGYERTSNPEPGDIVTSGSHCGIYIGNGQMIHASDYGIGVVIGNVQSDMIAVKS